MKLEITGISTAAAAALGVESRTHTALRAGNGAVRECRVAFVDVNGPKGGKAIRCTIEVGLVRRAAIHVSARAVTVPGALIEALDRMRQRLQRTIEAERDSARHPKKYFAAVRASMQATL